MAKQDDYVRYTIRVPAGLYERLQKAAGEKSINAEIVARLEASLPATSEMLTPAQFKQVLEAKLAKMIESMEEFTRMANDAPSRSQPGKTVAEAAKSPLPPPRPRRPDESIEEYLATPDGAPLRAILDSYEREREAVGENIEPLPKKPKIVPATKRKIRLSK